MRWIFGNLKLNMFKVSLIVFGLHFAAGLLEKLKVDECKIYLKKNGLRLTGNKDTLIQRIKEHQE
jgi:hypothetical protein